MASIPKERLVSVSCKEEEAIESEVPFLPGDYDVRFVREEKMGGRRCHVVEFRPRGGTANGSCETVWVDVETHLPLRVEGEGAEGLLPWLRSIFLAHCQAGEGSATEC